ncbi:MAG: hypothetical protein J2P37_34865 [Ktedonobacteraceae bacterium]|nr:hypothetical protein [Ktedonobacteraceae bacterium]
MHPLYSQLLPGERQAELLRAAEQAQLVKQGQRQSHHSPGNSWVYRLVVFLLQWGRRLERPGSVAPMTLRKRWNHSA